MGVSQSRRQSMRLMIGAAILPTLVMGLPRLARAAGSGFDPPSGPMRLSRTLIRDLPDGAVISVRREWEVRFSPAADGFSVSGRQTAVEVEAPPVLEALRQLEKQRKETNLFPLMLLPSGLIAAGGQEADAELFDLAVAEAAKLINRSALSAGDASVTGKSLAVLQKSVAVLLSRVPHDLFRPGQSHWQDDREVVLPQGQTGTVSVMFNAQMNASGQLMEQSERRIVSTIGTSSRTSSETWELTRA